MSADGLSDPADPRLNALNHLVTDLDGEPVAVDVRRAVIATHATVSLTTDGADRLCFAVQLQGHTVAQEQDVRLLVLLDTEGVATLVSLLIEAAAHGGTEYLAQLLEAIGQRVTG